MFGVPKPRVQNQAESLLNKYQQGSQNQATGNKVYNGFAPSPHAGGGLDKSGYQQRDQKARTKKQFLMNQLKSGGF